MLQTPLIQLCTAPQKAHDGPQAVRFDEWVEQASSDPSVRMHWNCPAGQVEGVVQTPSMQLWVLPQTAHDGPQALRFEEWSEHASPVPSARAHTNCPGGHDVRVMQTPLTQLCVAPQTAHDGPQAVRFEEWVEQASPVPSARMQMNWPAGQVVGVVQTPFTQFWLLPQTAHDEPHALRFDA